MSATEKRDGGAASVERVELLPCPNPWCGHSDSHKVAWTTRDGWWVNCACEIASPRQENEALAVAVWNRRTPAGPASSDEEVEAAARALYLEFNGTNPDWPIGVDKNGYHQEPYVGSVPSWRWFWARHARVALAASSVRQDTLREALAKLIDEMAERRLWADRPHARLALVAASRLVRRGRPLTTEEQLALLEVFLNEGPAALSADTGMANEGRKG